MKENHIRKVRKSEERQVKNIGKSFFVNTWAYFQELQEIIDSHVIQCTVDLYTIFLELLYMYQTSFSS